ncbi:MAG: RHS repeat-associated core domain-containing protein, partial [Gemmatimonadota bacterium]
SPVRDTIKYDRSGNRVTLVHNAGGPNFLSSYLFPSASNRLPWQRDSVAGGSTATARFYELDTLGAMTQEADSAGGGLQFFRGYQYDALGRLVGGAHASGGGTNTLYNECRWDASGRLAKPCDEFPLGFVGNNVVRTANGWFYVHAPGLDEPLLLVKRNINTWAIEADGLLQALTDGRGQLIAIADSLGEISATYAGSGYDQSTWKGAGLTSRAQTFSPRKWEAGSDWGGVQQFRNRGYDPGTGRWMQEDPIGVGGGVNLYQYNRGNPASFSDPFGLCPPCSDRDEGWANTSPGFLDPIMAVASIVTGGATTLLGRIGARSLTASAATAASSTYLDVTVGRSVANRATSATAASVERTLMENGFARQASRDERVLNFVKGGVKYTLGSRGNAGPMTLEMTMESISKKPLLKIRLEQLIEP